MTAAQLRKELYAVLRGAGMTPARFAYWRGTGATRRRPGFRIYNDGHGGKVRVYHGFTEGTEQETALGIYCRLLLGAGYHVGVRIEPRTAGRNPTVYLLVSKAA